MSAHNANAFIFTKEQSHRLAAWLAVAYVVLIPIGWTPFAAGIQWADWVLAALFSSCLLSQDLKALRAGRFELAIGAYFAVSAVSALSAHNAQAFVELAKIASGVMVYLVFALLGQFASLRRHILSAGAWTTLSIALLCAVSMTAAMNGFADLPFVEKSMIPGVGELVRSKGFLLTPGFLSNYLAFGLPLVLAEAVSAGKTSARFRWFAAACITGLVALSTATPSLLGVAAASLIFFWQKLSAGRVLRGARAVLLAGTVFLGLGVFITSNVFVAAIRWPSGSIVRAVPDNHYVFKNVQWRFGFGEYSIDCQPMSYLLLKRIAVASAAQHPLTGVGLGGFAQQTNTAFLNGKIHETYRYSDPHCELLGRFAETGVFGALTLLLLWFAAFQMGRAVLLGENELAFNRALAAGGIGLLINSANAEIMNFRFFWVLLGLLRASSILQKQAKQASPAFDGRRRIVRIITRMNIGGPSIHVALLSTQLPERFSTCLVLGVPDANEGDQSQRVAGSSARMVRIKSLGRRLSPLNDLSAFLQLTRVLWKERPNIVHTHMAKAGTLGRLACVVYNSIGPGRQKGCRALIVHTFHGHVLEGYFSSPISRFFITIERYLAGHTDCLVAVSPAIRDDLIRKGVGRPQQWRVIPLGLDLSALMGLPPPKSSTSFRVGMVGRLVPVKNPSLFLHAVQGLSRRFGPLPSRGILVGDGPLRHTLEKEVRELGLERLVEFHGWQQDLPAVYQQLDAACVTSWNEGTPVSLIEAMAAGRPVIATDVGGVRDLLDEAGGQPEPITEGEFEIAARGILVRSNDAAGLIAALSRVAEDALLRERLSEAARKHVAVHYAQERLLRDITHLYDELETGGRP